MDKVKLQKYAKLIVGSGLNVQKGQKVIIECGLDQPEFVAMVVEECYLAGASTVLVKWSYMPVTKLNYVHRSLETLSKVTEVEKAEWQDRLDNLSCRLWLDSDDPDGLDGTD
ncbi:MAG: aminopeptidase, partial [Clostridia bacterium]|nr:aminopeptidase [Clostridia bacterium]